MKKTFLATAILAIAPAITFAAQQNNDTLFTKATGWISTLNVILFSVVVLAFTTGVALYVFDKEKNPEKLKSRILWPLVAVIVLASLWGIVKLVQTTIFGSGNQNNAGDITAPALPGAGTSTSTQTQNIGPQI
ncbi:hypothetical protein CSB11_01960 [Candidatus Campbellbacteria bacterium]|nr:MAG: hypothetical protein CSB11_01960 [Candidatus Campbellbacteria bacterium]